MPSTQNVISKAKTGDFCLSFVYNNNFDVEVTFDVVSSFLNDGTFDYEDGTGYHVHTPYEPYQQVEEIDVVTVVAMGKDGVWRDKKAPKRVASFLKSYIQNDCKLMQEVSEIYAESIYDDNDGYDGCDDDSE